jgi:arsenate reductase
MVSEMTVDRELARRALAEAVGTALLVIAVVGSGIAATRLSPGDTGLQLLENALATAGGLAAVIIAVGSVSGAHLNPIVTLAQRALGGIDTGSALAYVAAQVVGGVVGVVLANLMFDLPAMELSSKARAGDGLFLAEIVATFGLLLVVFGVARSGDKALGAFGVAAYIGGAYFFTSSTSFANPAVTIARMLTETFTGIAPRRVPVFIGAQVLGGALGVLAVKAFYPRAPESAPDVVVPHGPDRA